MCKIVETLESLQRELQDIDARLVRLCEGHHDQRIEDGCRFMILTRKHPRDLATAVDQYLRCGASPPWQLAGEWKAVTSGAGKTEYAQALVRTGKPDCRPWLLPYRDATCAKAM